MNNLYFPRSESAKAKCRGAQRIGMQAGRKTQDFCGPERQTRKKVPGFQALNIPAIVVQGLIIIPY